MLEDPDFRAEFDGKGWSVRWKWKDGEAPTGVLRGPESYTSAKRYEQEVSAELEEWKSKGWLIPFNERPVASLPLMAVAQTSKGKIRPVLDYRALNEFVSSHTAESLVCADKLRKWRRMGRSLAIVDLRRAYLQVEVDRDLWPYQVIKHDGQSWCLTRLGFGLSVAPKIMRRIIEHVLDSDSEVAAATDAYYDDIIVDTSKVSIDRVMDLLTMYGL